MQLDEINEYLPIQENKVIEIRPVILQDKNDEEKIDKEILFAHASLFEKANIEWSNILDENGNPKLTKKDCERFYNQSCINLSKKYNKIDEIYKGPSWLVSKPKREDEKNVLFCMDGILYVNGKRIEYENNKAKIESQHNNLFTKLFNKKQPQQKQLEELKLSFIKLIIRELNPSENLLKTFGYEKLIQNQSKETKKILRGIGDYKTCLIKGIEKNRFPEYIKNLDLTNENTKFIEKLIIENKMEPKEIIPEYVSKENIANAKYLEKKYNLPYSIKIEVDIRKIGRDKEYMDLLEKSLQNSKQQNHFWKTIVNTEHSNQNFTLPDKSFQKSAYDYLTNLSISEQEYPNIYKNIKQMMNCYDKKYELTNSTIKFDEQILCRIKALKDFGDVKAGDLGGYVSNEDNLSQNGNCWVYDDAKVYGLSEVRDNATIHQISLIRSSTVTGDSIITGDSKISDTNIKDSKIEDAKICCSDINNSKIKEGIYEGKENEDSLFRSPFLKISSAKIEGNNIKISGKATIENSKIQIKQECEINDEAEIKNANIKCDTLNMSDNAKIIDPIAPINTSLYLYGKQVFNNSLDNILDNIQEQNEEIEIKNNREEVR